MRGVPYRCSAAKVTSPTPETPVYWCYASQPFSIDTPCGATRSPTGAARRQADAPRRRRRQDAGAQLFPIDQVADRRVPEARSDWTSTNERRRESTTGGRLDFALDTPSRPTSRCCASRKGAAIGATVSAIGHGRRRAARSCSARVDGRSTTVVTGPPEALDGRPTCPRPSPSRCQLDHRDVRPSAPSSSPAGSCRRQVLRARASRRERGVDERLRRRVAWTWDARRSGSHGATGHRAPAMVVRPDAASDPGRGRRLLHRPVSSASSSARGPDSTRSRRGRRRCATNTSPASAARRQHPRPGLAAAGERHVRRRALREADRRQHVGDALANTRGCSRSW